MKQKNKSNYHETILVGAGFSAFLIKILYNKKITVFSLKKSDVIQSPFLNRSNSFRIGKFLSPATKYCGKLTQAFNQASLHAFQKIGGNSNIWGGFINISGLPNFFLEILARNNISVKKINLLEEGCVSNSPNICQLQLPNNKIFNASYCFNNFENYFLYSFSVSGKFIKLEFISGDNRGLKKVFFCNNLILAVGVVDLIDLLYRSKYISEDFNIELAEFSYIGPSLKFKKMTGQFRECNNTIIRFNLLKALCHLIGYQSKVRFNSFFNFIPIIVEQAFSLPLHRRIFKIKNGALSINKEAKSKKNKYFFGKSIHYCNMKINNQKINSFLSLIHPNLIGLGMAFVRQKKAGPISNDIALDAIKKLRRL